MKASLLHKSEIDKPQWDKLVSESHQGSIFTESGYLDTILPGAWSGICLYDGNDLAAVMPVSVGKKWGFSYALQPILAKYWGIIFRQNNLSGTYKEYSFKKKAMNAIIECIPKNLISFSYNFHPAFDYPLPFIWKSYTVTTNYTFLLDARDKSEDTLMATYSNDLKKNIRASQNLGITVIKDISASALIHILEQNRLAGKTIYNPGYYPLIENIANYGLASDSCFCLTALNTDNVPIGSSLYLKDHSCVYTLISIADKKFSKTDVSSLLLHKAILESSALQCTFDFLGSMIEPIEAFNRRFGAIPIPYLNISKKSRFLFDFGK